MRTLHSKRCTVGLLTLALCSGAATAESLRFIWESLFFEKPGYVQEYRGIVKEARVEQRAEAGKGHCTLVEAGRPAAVIVLSARPTRAAQVAAAELRHYVERISGAALAVVSDRALPFDGPKVLVGDSQLTRALGLKPEDFEEQEYLIRSYGDLLVLMGHDEQEFGVIDYEGTGLWPEFSSYYEWKRAPECTKKIGSVYAVDEFLERCLGVRWFMPGPMGEVCPTRPTLAVSDLDLRLRPWTDYRWYGPESFRDYLDFIGSRKPDVSYPAKVGQAGWRDINLWMMRMKVFGTEAYGANHSLIGPWFRQRFQDQPEVWGDLVAKGHGEDPMQLCLTSERLADILVEDAKAYADGRSNYERACGRYFPVMAHDTSSGWCTCARCAAVLKTPGDDSHGFWNDRASAYMWGLVDRVARRLKEEAPGMWVSCCSYAGYALPPPFALSDNIAVTYCRVLCDSFRDPGYRMFQKEWFRAWAGRVSRLYLWEYYDHIQSNGHERYFPGVILGEAERDMRFMRSIGVKGVFNEMNSLRSCIPNIAQDHLNLYVWLKLAAQDQKQDLDVDDLLADYCQRFYGPAEKPMETFFRLLETRFSDPANYRQAEGVHPHQVREVNDWARVGPPAVLARFGQALAEARSLATESPYRDRVELMRQAVYGMMVRNGNRFMYGYVRDPAEAGFDEPTRPFLLLGDNDGYAFSLDQIDVDRAGNVYAANASAAEVVKFGPRGDVLLRIPTDGPPRCVSVDATGSIYVAGYRKVMKFRPDGAKAFDFMNGTKYAVAEDRHVNSLAVDSRGAVWCVEEGRSVTCYGADGTAVADIGFPAGLALKRPVHVKVRGDTLYVLDHEARTVVLWDMGSESFETLSIPEPSALPTGFGVDGRGRVYVAVSDRVKVFERRDGAFAEAAEHRLDPPHPRDIAFDAAGSVYVATGQALRRYRPEFSPEPAGGGAAAFGDGWAAAGRFAAPMDACAGRDGALFVCDFADDKVQKLAPDGSPVWSARTKRAHNGCLDVDSTGSVYVGNMSYPVITKLSPDGAVLLEKGKGLLAGSVRGLAVGPGDCVYVSEYGSFDGQYCTRLWKLTADLDPVEDFGQKGHVFLELNGKRLATTRKIVVDGEGNVYWVAGAAGVAKLRPDGTAAKDFRRGTSPVLNMDASPYWTWAVDKQLTVIEDIALADNGDLFVLDGTDSRVVRMDPNGRYVGQFGFAGYAPGMMRGPKGLCLAGGELFVTDTGNSRVYRLPTASVR